MPGYPTPGRNRPDLPGQMGTGRGLVNRLEDSIRSTMGRIEERAGKETDTLGNYALGKRMKQVETRYWNQFTQMEKAIQRLNDQSAQLFS